MAPETQPIIWGIIAAALGGAGLWGFVQYLLSRRSSEAKAKAETGNVEADTRSKDADTYAQMQETIKELSLQVEQISKARQEDRAKIDQLETEIRELKRERLETDDEVARLQRIVRYYRSGVKKLIEQLREQLGVDPVWEPEDDPEGEGDE